MSIWRRKGDRILLLSRSDYMKNTERLIKLLQQREEMLGLPSDEYDELYELLEGELKTVKETLDFYEEGVK